VKPPFQRRTAFLAVLLAPTLAACGFGAQTDQVYQAAQGVNDRSGTVWVLDALIVAAKDGSGTFAGSLVNEAAKSQSIANVTGVDVTPAGVNIVIPGNQLVDLAKPVPGTEQPQLTFSGPGVKLGGFVRLTFTYSGGGTSTVNVPVVSNDPKDGSEFANVPLPIASPTGAGTATP
jgi:hypothetical protein